MLWCVLHKEKTDIRKRKMLLKMLAFYSWRGYTLILQDNLRLYSQNCNKRAKHNGFIFYGHLVMSLDLSEILMQNGSPTSTWQVCLGKRSLFC